MVRLLYRPLGLLFGVLGGVIASAVFGLVKTAVDRGGAVGFRKLTGEWPGDTSSKTHDD